MPWIPRVHGVIVRRAVYFTEHNTTNTIPSRLFIPFFFLILRQFIHVNIVFWSFYSPVTLPPSASSLYRQTLLPSKPPSTFIPFGCFAVTR